MTSIGKQLEEARSTQGISLHEMSEATKVRSDFLEFFEADNFDFDLPEIYKRGFLKLYALRLKLDAEKILSEYDARVPGALHATPAEPHSPEPSFGKLEQVSPKAQEQWGDLDASAKKSSPETQTRQEGEASDALLYWKIFGVFGGLLILVSLLAVGIQALTASPEPDEVQDEKIITAAPAPNFEGEATLIGLEDATVIVRQLSDGKTIFQGAIAKDERYKFEHKGDIVIIAPQIEKIAVEVNGKIFQRDASGFDKWFFRGRWPPNFALRDYWLPVRKAKGELISSW